MGTSNPPPSHQLYSLFYYFPSCQYLVLQHWRVLLLSFHVPCWLGVMGTRGKWLFEYSCFWDRNKDQAASSKSRELIVRFSIRSLTLKTIESGSKSKFHCVPLLDTVNCIVLIVRERSVRCRNVWKTIRKVNLCCSKAADGNVKRLFHVR